MIKKFSIEEAISFGWEETKNNLGFFISLLLVSGLISFAPEIIGLFLGAEVEAFLNIIFIPVFLLIGLGYIKITLGFCNKQGGRFEDLFSQYRLIGRYFLAGILYGLIVFIGLFLLVIPGIYLGIRLWFFDYFIVDQNAGVVESLEKSWQVTQGSTFSLLIFFIAIFVLNVLGMLLLIVGLFVTIPITMLACAFIYYELLSNTEMEMLQQ